MKRIMAIFMLFLSGCTLKYMEEGLAALRNQPVQTAFAVLGYPDNEVRPDGLCLELFDFLHLSIAV